MSFAVGTSLRLLGICYFVRWRLIARLRSDNRRMRQFWQAFYRHIWNDAADAIGARFSLLPNGGAEIERDGRVLTVYANRTSLNSEGVFRPVVDKEAAHLLLSEAGVPVPEHLVVGAGQFDKAVRMLSASRVPLVVKPAANTGGGAGVSTNVTTEYQLKVAIAWARAFCPRILIEKQIEGDCYRILLIDGEVLDAIVRHPPRVTGDGTATIRQLLEQENRLRLQVGMARAHTLIRFDSDLRNTLASQGRTLHSRPMKGESVTVKHVINENCSRENVSAVTLGSEIIQSARTAAEVVGARLAGVDIICRDPSVSLERSGGVVIEVNATPGLYWHYHRADTRVPVAEGILGKFFNIAIADGDRRGRRTRSIPLRSASR